MKKTIIAALALVVMAGCNKTLIEMPVVDDAGYGYINFDISADSDMVVTKTDETNTDTYQVTLWQSEDNSSFAKVWDKQFSVIKNTQVEAESGKYYKVTVENEVPNSIYNHEGSAIAGKKHFYGESDAQQLVAGGNINLQVVCNVKNTAVSVKPTANFTNTFINEVVTVSVDERSWKFIEVKNDNAEPVAETNVSFEGAEMVYFPAETQKTDSESQTYYCANLTITISASTASTQSKTYTITRESKRACWTQITLDAGQNGAIQVTITATDDMNGTPVSETVTLDPLTDQEV